MCDILVMWNALAVKYELFIHPERLRCDHDMRVIMPICGAIHAKKQKNTRCKCACNEQGIRRPSESKRECESECDEVWNELKPCLHVTSAFVFSRMDYIATSGSVYT